MVAIIKVGSSIRRTFHYNENKVKEGVAELIMAANYPMDVERMQESHRLNMLLRTAESNPNVRANSVHISLNFAQDDVVDNEKLKLIADEYMQAIGFGNQPFLVYRHHDAGHDHIHIVTVKVGLDGQRIETNNIGKERSEPARKDIEIKYGLVSAEQHKGQQEELKAVDASKVQYGKTATKRAIGNVLEEVISKYKFTSVPEMNAVLKLYNVYAETGKEGSRLNRFGGLLYRILDSDGNPVGVPVKASLFHSQPTLRSLEKLFVKNDVARQQYKKRLQTAIAFMLKTRQPKSLNELKEILHRDNIRLIPRHNKDGVIYGITYVDLKTKCVFNGSALGKQFSAKALLAAIHLKEELGIQNTTSHSKDSINHQNETTVFNRYKSENQHEERQMISDEKSLLELLTQHEFAASAVPYEWRKKKKKKR